MGFCDYLSVSALTSHTRGVLLGYFYRIDPCCDGLEKAETFVCLPESLASSTACLLKKLKKFKEDTFSKDWEYVGYFWYIKTKSIPKQPNTIHFLRLLKSCYTCAYLPNLLVDKQLISKFL